MRHRLQFHLATIADQQDDRVAHVVGANRSPFDFHHGQGGGCVASQAKHGSICFLDAVQDRRPQSRSIFHCLRDGFLNLVDRQQGRPLTGRVTAQTVGNDQDGRIVTHRDQRHGIFIDRFLGRAARGKDGSASARQRVERLLTHVCLSVDMRTGRLSIHDHALPPSLLIIPLQGLKVLSKLTGTAKFFQDQAATQAATNRLYLSWLLGISSLAANCVVKQPNQVAYIVVDV